MKMKEFKKLIEGVPDKADVDFRCQVLRKRIPMTQHSVVVSPNKNVVSIELPHEQWVHDLLSAKEL